MKETRTNAEAKQKESSRRKSDSTLRLMKETDGHDDVYIISFQQLGVKDACTTAATTALDGWADKWKGKTDSVYDRTNN